MNQITSLLLAVAFALTYFHAQTKVYAQEYEEVTYEDLVNRLSKKRKQVSENSVSRSVLDDIMIHTGFALTQSHLDFALNGNQIYGRVNGFQLSAGIDLFSNFWAAEAVIRNQSGSGDSTLATEVKSLREMDLTVYYHRAGTVNIPGYKFGFGLGNRILRAANDSGISIEEYTPMAVFFTGLDLAVNRNLSFGGEVDYRASMIGDSKDHASLDFLLRLDLHY